MILSLLRSSVLALPVLFLAACASGPQVDPSVAAALSSHGVNQGTYIKVTQGRVLDYNDILDLVQHKVPSHVIVGYLQSTRKAYNFSYGQLQSLKEAGASTQVLNFLTETQGFYGNNSPQQSSRFKKEQKDRYFNSPYYQDKAPFARNVPEVDTWYDSSYEESLYSPFSFN